MPSGPARCMGSMAPRATPGAPRQRSAAILTSHSSLSSTNCYERIKFAEEFEHSGQCFLCWWSPCYPPHIWNKFEDSNPEQIADTLGLDSSTCGINWCASWNQYNSDPCGWSDTCSRGQNNYYCTGPTYTGPGCTADGTDPLFSLDGFGQWYCIGGLGDRTVCIRCDPRTDACLHPKLPTHPIFGG